jgi:hypothetical protein
MEGNKLRIYQKTTQYPPPILCLPRTAGQEFFISPKKIDTFEFYALSDGTKRVYYEEDAIKGYGVQKILDPKSVSYINLFINAVLQPKACYHIEVGKMTILTDDLPAIGSPIILQIVKI